MEVFTGGRPASNDIGGFSDSVMPFPEVSDVFYDNRTDDIHPPAAEKRLIRPPQKLCPIRCNNRGLPAITNGSGGVDGGFMNCDGVDYTELGFLAQFSTAQICSVNGVGEECGSGGVQSDVRSSALPENGDGDIAASVCSLMETPAAVIHQMKSEMEAEYMNIISQARLLEDKLSSSSDEGGESSEASGGRLNQKRKRKSRKRLEFFLENMVQKMMQKQEQMHQQLIEMIEHKEKERIIREEAWKQVQIERAKRAEELRSQETSRSLALISFLQNLVGNEIQTPQSLRPSCPEKDEDEIHNQEDGKSDQANKRWPKSEVQALITVRTALEHKYHQSPKGTAIWEDVSVQLSNMGYHRSAKKCKEKWENMNKYYRRTMESGKRRPGNSKSCQYFDELDILYKTGVVTSIDSPDHIKKESEERGIQE